MNNLVAHVRRIVKAQGQFKPLMVTDIDGVLVRGSTPVAGTRDAVIKLKEEGIPLALLTNGGGNLERIKTAKMNQIFNEQLFDPTLMFMSHSPMRPHLKKYSQEGLLLITGSLKIEDIVGQMGITNYIIADELYALLRGEQKPSTAGHQDLVFYEEKESVEAIRSRVMKRLKRDSLPHSYKEWTEQIKAIFALNDVNPYEKALEVIHNIFQQKYNQNKPLPPYFAGHNDIAFAGGYHRPRMAFGPFNYMLEHHCQTHGFALNNTYFGKPVRGVFDYVKDVMVERFGDGCFFMVGDNPRADIQGANTIDWASFLTQTGVHQGPENDPENPATMVVNTFAESVEALVKIKKDKLYLQ